MKSLLKSLDILECVILGNGRSMTPGAVAEKTNLNISTCTRIMGELVARGYLVKESRRTGYLPGPMSASLVTRKNVYTRLAEAYLPELSGFAKEIGMTVNLAVLHEGERIMIAVAAPSDSTLLWKRFRFGNELEEAATSRLLLGAASAGESERVFDSLSTPESLRKTILSEAHEGFSFFELGSLQICGALVREKGFPDAAFGFGIPKGKMSRARLKERLFSIIAEARKTLFPATEKSLPY